MTSFCKRCKKYNMKKNLFITYIAKPNFQYVSIKSNNKIDIIYLMSETCR